MSTPPELSAGFARADLTPPVGIPLVGCGPAWERLSENVIDPVHVRILALSQGDEAALLLTFDTCFVGRQESEALKASLGRRLGLRPAQILCASTHSHAGPAYDAYLDLETRPAPRDWLRLVEERVTTAAEAAWSQRRPVKVRAACGTTSLPMNRRRPRDGTFVNAPHPSGSTHDKLPLCLLEDANGTPVCLLFLISTHPVAVRGTGVSADYPGLACTLLDEYLGTPCAIFLQGAAGDSRPRTLGEGRDEWLWASNETHARQIAEILASEVKPLLRELKEITPRLRTALIESHWPLAPLGQEELLAIEALGDGRQAWARRQLDRLKWGALPDRIGILMQGIQLGEGLRIVAMEGEPLSPHAHAVEAAFDDGITFPAGYANGEGMYLVTSDMLAEGGYEPTSFPEYGQPGPLAPGLEAARDAGLQHLKQCGIG